jgi:poly(hydroxyalkanoate) depolymerase family esterase
MPLTIAVMRTRSGLRAARAAMIAGSCACLWWFGLASSAMAAGSPAPCAAPHWVGAWEAAPSNASSQFPVDASGHAQLVIDDNTVRAILTPTYAGSVLRVHLSNRFGTAPVTFARATVGLSTSGAAVASGSLRELVFRHSASVTVMPGHDVVSDATPLRFRAFQSLAVSVYVHQAVGAVTEHFQARQTSYATASRTGDATRIPSGGAFTVSTTTRPFVDGIDVRAPSRVGAVVALGDSITDGSQNQPNGVFESPVGISANVRYPDWLARRLLAAHLPLSSLNAGLAGNKLLQDGTYGGNLALYGPSALHRLDVDVLRQAGVTTVILDMGINDASQKPLASPAQIIAGYKTIIARMQRAHLRVLQGTLTPTKGYPPTVSVYPQEEATREAVNQWIRTQSPADAIVDFDAAVRDHSDPTRLNPPYDDGEHLHFSAAGYRRLAETVPLDDLALPACGRRLGVRVSPRAVIAGQTTTIHVTISRSGRPVAHALVRVGQFQAHTNAGGRTDVRVRFPTNQPAFVAASTSNTVTSASRITVRYLPFPGPGKYTHHSFTFRGDPYHYSLYVPSTYRGRAAVPLLVMIHGCNTTADQQAMANEYGPLAERHDFIVLYPDVDPADAGIVHCWKGLWRPAGEERGRGDAGAIAGMTGRIAGTYRVDRTRMYAIGMSSGGAETSILGAAYPDLYAAIGIHSSLAYMRGSKGCLGAEYKPGPPTARLAREAYLAMGHRARVMPVILFHGDRDHTDPYQCGRQALAQWLATDDLVAAHTRTSLLPLHPSSVTQGRVLEGRTYTVSSYARARCTVVQFWTIHGMDHFWSGGTPQPALAEFTDPSGPSAAEASWAFFSAHRLSRLGVPPCGL